MLKDFIQRITFYGLENVLHRYYSRYPGRVINNKRDDGKQELELFIPIIHKPGTSTWVKSYGIPAGQNYGLQSIPRIGDMVYVTFAMGDIRSPRWNYGWYAKGELPEEFKDINVHGFKSPAGHSVLINDTDSTIKITMKDGKTFMIGTESIELNGDELGGLIKIKELKLELDKLNNQWTAFKQVISVPIPEPGAGSPSVLGQTLNAALAALPLPTYLNIENTNIKHGDR